MVIVYTDGVFDLFHCGHINMFKKCLEIGDYIIAGVHSDKTVKQYKGNPILNFKERSEMVKACKYVNKVVEGPLKLTKDFLEKYNIDCVVHAHDKGDKSYDMCFENIKDKLIRIDYYQGISTTDIIERIKNF